MTLLVNDPVSTVPGKKWIGTSWKMNKVRAEAREYAERLVRAPGIATSAVQAFVVPPMTALVEVADILADSDVLVGAQNAHWAPGGPWTGEVSVAQVKDAGARLVEIGHSERRQHFAESDMTVNLKVRATLDQGLIPLICVGEPAEVFRQGRSVPYVLAQVEAALSNVRSVDDVLVAYEPIWAIGSAGRPAAPAEISEVFAALGDRLGDDVMALLYGGSVSAGNAAELLRIPEVGGLFIGRAAWSVDGYLEIVDIAQQQWESEQPAPAHRTPDVRQER